MFEKWGQNLKLEIFENLMTIWNGFAHATPRVFFAAFIGNNNAFNAFPALGRFNALYSLRIAKILNRNHSRFELCLRYSVFLLAVPCNLTVAIKFTILSLCAACHHQSRLRLFFCCSSFVTYLQFSDEYSQSLLILSIVQIPFCACGSYQFSISLPPYYEYLSLFGLLHLTFMPYLVCEGVIQK